MGWRGRAAPRGRGLRWGGPNAAEATGNAGGCLHRDAIQALALRLAPGYQAPPAASTPSPPDPTPPGVSRPDAARVHDALVQLERGAVPAGLQPTQCVTGEHSVGADEGQGEAPLAASLPCVTPSPVAAGAAEEAGQDEAASGRPRRKQRLSALTSLKPPRDLDPQEPSHIPSNPPLLLPLPPNPPLPSQLLINKVSEEEFLQRSRKQAGKRQTVKVQGAGYGEGGGGAGAAAAAPVWRLGRCLAVG